MGVARIKGDDDVLALYEEYLRGNGGQGMSLFDLHLEYGIDERSIARHFRRLGLTIRPKGDRSDRPDTNKANARPVDDKRPSIRTGVHFHGSKAQGKRRRGY